MSKLSFKLPRERSGEFLLTPTISQETGVGMRDLEPLINELSTYLGEDLWMEMLIVSEGVRLSWGPASDVELDDICEGAFGEAPSNEVVDDDLDTYLQERYDALNPEKKEQ